MCGIRNEVYRGKAGGRDKGSVSAKCQIMFFLGERERNVFSRRYFSFFLVAIPEQMWKNWMMKVSSTSSLN